MADRWGPVLQLVAANTAYAGAVGYVLGRCQPLRRARRRARDQVLFGTPVGRLRSAVVVLLLPDLFVPLIWHRVRHGQWPQPPRRRRAPAPALVQRGGRRTAAESPCAAPEGEEP